MPPPRPQLYYQPSITLNLWFSCSISQLDAFDLKIKTIDAARPWIRCYKPDGDPAPSIMMSTPQITFNEDPSLGFQVLIHFGPGAPIKSERIDDYRRYVNLLVQRIITQVPNIYRYRCEQNFKSPVTDIELSARITSNAS